MPKKVATPEPPKEEEPPPVQEPPPELLEGDFTFPDGSEYSGQYIRTNDDLCFHGQGHFKSGPEAFDGAFEQGNYKKGTYKSCGGAVYTGSFCQGAFNGPGEYVWPDGRIYQGMWKGGSMHGRGKYQNFSFGVDRLVEGFSFHGAFDSSASGQENARKAFAAEYGTEYADSAIAALHDLAERAEKYGVVPRDFVVPAPPANGEEEDPQAAEERAYAEAMVSGPFPQASDIKLGALKGLDAAFPAGGERLGAVFVFEDSAQRGQFDAGRLQREQLGHIGQAVELSNPDPQGESLKALVLVNVSPEYEAARAAWKIAFCEAGPVVDDPPDNPKKK